MSTHALAWAAGLFEGEGSISIRKDTLKGKQYRYIRLQVDTTDKDVLEAFQKAVGVGRIYGGESGYTSLGSLGKKKVWKWACSGSTAWELANRLRIFLGKRRNSRLDEIAEELNLHV